MVRIFIQSYKLVTTPKIILFMWILLSIFFIVEIIQFKFFIILFRIILITHAFNVKN